MRRHCISSSISHCSTTTCPTRPGVRRHSLQSTTSLPFAGRHSSASAGRTRSSRLERHRDGRGQAQIPPEPHVLRELHRGIVFLRRVRVRLFPAFARACCPAWPPARTGCSATKRAHGLCVLRDRYRATRGARALRRALGTRSFARMIVEAVECECEFAEDVLAGRVVVGLTRAEMRQISASTSPISVSRCWGSRLDYGARNPFPSWSCRTCRNQPTFSSGVCRPIRSACRAKSASMLRSEESHSGLQ